jgi:tRNA (adenine37-N6)-methyltransferase
MTDARPETSGAALAASERQGDSLSRRRRDGSLIVEPIGYVSSPRDVPLDDDWDTIVATIALAPDRFTPEALRGLDAFSHVEVVYVFDRVDPASIETSSRHPRGNRGWPRVGVFAQRAKSRPNRIGVSVCELLGVDQLTVTVRALDAIDGTPVLDLKPYMQEFAVRGEVRQPQWSRELMAGYWSLADSRVPADR